MKNEVQVQIARPSKKKQNACDSVDPQGHHRNFVVVLASASVLEYRAIAPYTEHTHGFVEAQGC